MGLTAIWATIAGIIGTLLGAILSNFLSAKSKIYRYFMCFAGGMLLALSLFELVPHAYENGVEALGKGNGSLYALAFFLLGIGGSELIAYLSDHKLGGHNHDHDAHCTHETEGIRAGVLMAVALMIHNLPEGFALGAAGSVSLRQGVLMGVMIALHNLPCGMAIALPLRKAGVKRWKTLLLAAASGIPMVLGALLGYWLGVLAPLATCAVVGVASGVILHLVFHELFREGFSQKDAFSALITLLSVLLGFFILQI